jgi:hypothetical protein
MARMRFKFYQHGGHGSGAKNEVLAVVLLKTAAFWYVTLCVVSNMTDVSDEPLPLLQNQIVKIRPVGAELFE